MVDVVSAIAGPAPDDTVSVMVNGQILTGWTDVRITRRCEGLPNDFEVGLTAQNPTDGSPVAAIAGQYCEVSIGKDTVITGHIDRDINEGGPDGHRLAIVGRGLCADLVDCSAEWSGGQINGANALDVAAKLAEPYGIYVYLLGSIDGLKPIPRFNLNYGETAQEIIDRICTYDGLLYYEDTAGNLVLARVGTKVAASGFTFGENVQTWSVTNAMDQRFSAYTCSQTAIDTLTNVGDGSTFFFTAPDPNVPRHRTMYLVAEAVTGMYELCQRRALWEASRRAGRGTAALVTADSWRDLGGALWEPNTLAPVTLPGLRRAAASQLCIATVSYLYDNGGGKRAEVALLPQEAFALQPIVIQPAVLPTYEDDPDQGVPY